MKKIKLILPLIAMATSLSGCWIEFGDNDGDSQQTIDAYYKDCNLNLAGDRLAMELQKHSFAKHTQWILYSQFNSYCSKKTLEDGSYRNSIEAIKDGSNVNQWCYSGKEAGGTGQREHVWPCANSGSLWVHNDSAGSHYVDGTGYFGGGSDLYHVRTCNGPLNNARGNGKFVDFDDKEFASIRKDVVEKGETGGKYTIKLQGLNSDQQYADKAEPDDHMKGDIARIVLYVWLHYSERGVTPSGNAVAKLGSYSYSHPYSEMTGNLSLTNIMGYTSLERCKEKLIEWNNMDKPSNVEKLRNKTVQAIQGNRNPFVDHPELVDKILK